MFDARLSRPRPSRIRFLAQVEGDRNPRAIALMRQYHVRDIAGKQDHQSRFRMNVDALRQEGREERGAAPLAGVAQKKRSALIGIDRIAGIDVVGSRPGRPGMYVHLVEVPAAVDIAPGFESPPDRPELPMVFGENAPRCLIGERIHVAHETPSGIAAEFELPGFGMPAALIRLGCPAALRLLRQNVFPQRYVEFGTILPDMREKRRREDIRVSGL